MTADGKITTTAITRPVDNGETWTERFSAGWSNGEVIVIRDIRAGVSGPFGDYPAADLDEAEKVLRANGYALSGPWSEHTNGHFAPLVTVPAGAVGHRAAEETDPASAEGADAGTYEHQVSDNGGKTWRTVAVGLDAADVARHREANEAGEGTAWRMLPDDGDDKARAIAMKAAELTAARRRFHGECDRPIGGRSRTKQFGRRCDAQLRRAGELGRLVKRLESELDALRWPVREVPPLDLERLPFATHVRTDAGWYEIVKVNRKTVKVVVDPGWDDLIPIKRIKEIHERKVKTDSAPAATNAATESYVSPWASV